MNEPAALFDRLLANPGRVAELSAEEVAAALSELAVLGATLATRLGPQKTPALAKSADRTCAVPPAASWSADDLLTIDEAAASLRVSPRWLYRHAKGLPFSRKLSRKVLRFSRSGIAKWLATKRP